MTDHVHPTTAPATPSPADAEPELLLQRFPRDRRLAAARVAAVAGLLGAAGGGWGDRFLSINPLFWYALAVLAVLVVRWLYKHHPQTLARRKAVQDHRSIKQSTAETKKLLTVAQQHLADLEARRHQRQVAIDVARTQAVELRTKALTAAGNALRNKKQQLSSERAKLGDGTPLRQSFVASKRLRHVEAALKNAVIADDPPQDINTLRIRYLAQQGFQSAADFVDYYVSDHGGRGERTYLRRTPGDRGTYVNQIGKGCAKNLLAWRNNIKERAEQSAPRTLTAAEEKMIRDRLHQEVARLKQDSDLAEKQRTDAIDAARAQEQRRHAELDAQQTQLETETRSEGNNLQRHAGRAASELRAAQARESRHATLVASYATITGPRFVRTMAWLVRD